MIGHDLKQTQEEMDNLIETISQLLIKTYDNDVDKNSDTNKINQLKKKLKNKYGIDYDEMWN